MTVIPAKLLLNWYACNGRDLPWRVKGGAHPNPYIVFVSEMMLQQTTVKTVIPYFERFMARFPTVKDLAQATEDEVFQYWQGLGYYTRARSLLYTARKVIEKYNGYFPQNIKEIAALKGFGPYSAASFAALAYNLPTTVIDGNVQRIMCRMYRLTAPLEQIQSQIRAYAEVLIDKQNAADYASAIMDLGAMICTPKKPQCPLCPWQKICLCANAADVEQIPQKSKPVKREVSGKVYIIANKKGEVYIRKRIEKGLLHGLYEFLWTEQGDLIKSATDSGLSVSHIFTHIKMMLEIMTVQIDTYDGDGIFVKPEELDIYPMSTLMRKVRMKALKK
ncbi:MAG: A/G-specific adenine glycosylase [Alphaproteobacteria bacterium]|nr:A/G-specific adenine glycosylase [Alphaproteobacteria bacterium]